MDDLLDLLRCHTLLGGGSALLAGVECEDNRHDGEEHLQPACELYPIITVSYPVCNSLKAGIVCSISEATSSGVRPSELVIAARRAC
jgi:hypothetical protein